MRLVVLGLNHKTVPVTIREQFAVSEESARSGLRHLDEQSGINEAVILSTCNRTEIYAVLGDGELEEGQVWEAAMYAGNYKLDNLTAFVDNNGLQIDGPITKVMSPLPIADKFNAFGWYVLSVNGHDMAELHDAIEKAKATKGKPTMIIMKTVKGKGIPEIENQVGWHGKAPSEEECERFIKVLEAE